MTQEKVVPIPKRTEDKMRRLCEAVTRRARCHPEFCDTAADNGRELISDRSFERNRMISASMCFDKVGDKIFRTPTELVKEDWDWPDFVGEDLVEEWVREAAREVGLDLSERMEVFIRSHEKGWIDIGVKAVAPGPKAVPEAIAEQETSPAP